MGRGPVCVHVQDLRSINHRFDGTQLGCQRDHWALESWLPRPVHLFTSGSGYSQLNRLLPMPPRKAVKVREKPVFYLPERNFLSFAAGLQLACLLSHLLPGWFLTRGL